MAETNNDYLELLTGNEESMDTLTPAPEQGTAVDVAPAPETDGYDEEEDEESIGPGLKRIMEETPRWLLGQWKMLLLIIACTVVYITMGFLAQSEMQEETALTAELKDWRIRCITRQGELTLLCRQSLLEQKLRQQGDTTLLPNLTPPYKIKIEH